MQYADNYIAQGMAKSVMQDLDIIIVPGNTEIAIKIFAEKELKKLGAKFWYHGLGALVQVGANTTESRNGKEYRATELTVQEHDVVTVDLMPMVNNCWGDYARTFMIGNIPTVQLAINFERHLQKHLIENFQPSMTGHDVFDMMDTIISEERYENLDYLGNLGHTIVQDPAKREYIEMNSKVILKNCLFTMEPHLCKIGNDFGIKYEDVFRWSKEHTKLIVV